jgi:hypothetical protein
MGKASTAWLNSILGVDPRLDRENDRLFIFIDGVGAEQCNAAANNGLVLFGGSRSFRGRQRSTGRISQSLQPITRGSDLVARLKEGLHQGFHVVRIHMIGIRSPGGVLLSHP